MQTSPAHWIMPYAHSARCQRSGFYYDRRVSRDIGKFRHQAQIQAGGRAWLNGFNEYRANDTMQSHFMQSHFR